MVFEAHFTETISGSFLTKLCFFLSKLLNFFITNTIKSNNNTYNLNTISIGFGSNIYYIPLDNNECNLIKRTITKKK